MNIEMHRKTGIWKKGVYTKNVRYVDTYLGTDGQRETFRRTDSHSQTGVIQTQTETAQYKTKTERETDTERRMKGKESGVTSIS